MILTKKYRNLKPQGSNDYKFTLTIDYNIYVEMQN